VRPRQDPGAVHPPPVVALLEDGVTVPQDIPRLIAAEFGPLHLGLGGEHRGALAGEPFRRLPGKGDILAPQGLDPVGERIGQRRRASRGPQPLQESIRISSTEDSRLDRVRQHLRGAHRVEQCRGRAVVRRQGEHVVGIQPVERPGEVRVQAAPFRVDQLGEGDLGVQRMRGSPRQGTGGRLGSANSLARCTSPLAYPARYGLSAATTGAYASPACSE
jgi:hypothetical protein